MIVMPKHFDGNEWFIIINLLIGYMLIWRLPKRFPLTVTIMILSYCIFVAITFDELLAAPPFDFYDMNDSAKSDITDMIMWFIYGPYGYLFLYLYDRWRIRGLFIIIYVFTWALISLGVEWIALFVNVFKYNSWILLYSFPIYILVESLLLIYFHFIQAYFDKTRIP